MMKKRTVFLHRSVGFQGVRRELHWNCHSEDSHAMLQRGHLHQLALIHS